MRIGHRVTKATCLVALGIQAAACSRPAPAPEDEAPAAGVPAQPLALDWGSRLGVVEPASSGAPCMTIANATVQPGDSITLVLVDSSPQLLATAIAIASDSTCATAMTGPEESAYRLSEVDVGGLAIAVLGRLGSALASDEGVRADLDGDGIPEQFRMCASSEGLHLTAWTGAPLTGTKRWHVYHYVGYDLEPNCEEADVVDP